jgi:hypothetical protein
MSARWFFYGVLAFMLTACGAQAAATEMSAPVEVEETPLATSTPGEPTLTPLPTPELLTATSTPPVPASATPTVTLLPPLVLPTGIPGAPASQPWIDTPSYPVQSGEQLLFRVYYDPYLWAYTQDQYGFPALANRQIPYCQIAKTRGRGLSPGWTVDHGTQQIGQLDFEVSRVSENGQLKFINYFGGYKIYTGFEVSFEERADDCVWDAEVVLTTLQTLAGPFNPTPTPTP